MNHKKQVHFYLSDEALAVINRRAQSTNKRGDWLSAAVLAYDALLEDTPRLEDAVALLKRIADRRQAP